MTHPLEVGFATDADLDAGTVKVLLFNCVIEGRDSDREVNKVSRTMSVDKFVEMMNYLPVEIAARIVGKSPPLSKI